MPGRLTIGLYNSYDPRRFHEAHRRALARAAPLAIAFDASLATFGFPFDEGRRREARRPDAPDLRTPLEIAEFVAASTSIGEGGAYFVDLARRGRFHVFDFPKRGFPPQLGTIVLTTERATCPRDTSARQIARDLLDGRSQCLVFGLGPHGTPDEVRAMAEWEFDVTSGQGLSLETCTALGACVAAIAAHAEAIDARPRQA